MEPILAPESIDLIALAPVIVLSVFAMMVLVVDLFGGRQTVYFLIWNEVYLISIFWDMAEAQFGAIVLFLTWMIWKN